MSSINVPAAECDIGQINTSSLTLILIMPELYQCYSIQYLAVNWDMLNTLIALTTPYTK